MEQYNVLDMIRGVDRESVQKILDEKGKTATLSLFAEFLNKRAYLTVDICGNIKRKRGNLILPIFAYLDTKEVLTEELFNSADLKEREKIDKIERFTNLDSEKVKSNFMKTLFNGNLDFSKKYGKELFLRDRESFFDIISAFALMGRVEGLKPLMVLGLQRLMKEYDERVFYIFISYMTKYRDDTVEYERANHSEKTVAELRNIVKQNRELLNSVEGLGILSSLKLLEERKLENEKRVLEKLEKEIGDIVKLTPLAKNEGKLLEFFI